MYHAHLLGYFTPLPATGKPPDGEIQAGETCRVPQGKTGAQTHIPKGKVTLLVRDTVGSGGRMEGGREVGWREGGR